MQGMEQTLGYDQCLLVGWGEKGGSCSLLVLAPTPSCQLEPPEDGDWVLPASVQPQLSPSSDGVC